MNELKMKFENIIEKSLKEGLLFLFNLNDKTIIN